MPTRERRSTTRARFDRCRDLPQRAAFVFFRTGPHRAPGCGRTSDAALRRATQAKELSSGSILLREPNRRAGVCRAHRGAAYSLPTNCRIQDDRSVAQSDRQNDVARTERRPGVKGRMVLFAASILSYGCSPTNITPAAAGETGIASV